ncbi:hypothetical protein OHS70_21425 [Streptomyces sp. NBC_00390]|uniref:hypothetical protein n=1 Tax=Streptomyces sp. NBC_00390 TaxID=2975736 RepID=UPI002E222A8C
MRSSGSCCGGGPLRQFRGCRALDVSADRCKIKTAPEFDTDKLTGAPNYLEQLGKYYGQHM